MRAVSKLFDELERAAWGGFIAAQSTMFARIEDDLRARFALTHTEFEVLLRLFKSPTGKMRIQELAARSLLSRSGTSRAVERLERAGYVARLAAVEDGRGAYAALTELGREHFAKAAPAHVELVRDSFLRKFSRDELAVLAALLRRVTDDEATSAAKPTVKRRRAAR